MSSMDFQDILNQKLKERRLKNSRYSMRAFAKSLDMDAGLLSKYLNGKREVPVQFMEQHGESLGIESSNLSKIEKERKDKEIIKSFRLKTPKADYSSINEIHRDVIQNWQYYALLELMKVGEFKPCHKWISKELHITGARAKKLVSELVSAKYLQVNEDGSWIDLTQGSSTHVLSDEEINMANKESQRRILDLAKGAIDEITPEFREQSSMMMATNKEKILKAKVLIRDFRRKLCDFLEDTNEYDSIYQLSLSLFPLTGKFQNDKGDQDV